MLNNSENIIGKNIKITYKYEDIDYLHLYPINSEESQEIITDVVMVIDDKGINDFAVELSRPFLMERQNACKREFLKDDLSQKISNVMGNENTLKLTK